MGDIARVAVAAAEAAAHSAQPEIWISVASVAAVEADANNVERRLSAGEKLPLAGVTVAVKDNIDVAGMRTTAGCPAYAYTPEHDAAVVSALVAAGVVIIGKTNMDQFATGLVGTRSPYGAVRNTVDHRYVSGGSSSGSAAAVALGQVDLALGTDTAGSGRVPAALNGIIGFKPTRGLISTLGNVPACASLDCVSLFTRSVSLAASALSAATRRRVFDPYQRSAPPTPPSPIRRIGIPGPGQLDLTTAHRHLFESACDRVERLGAGFDTVDMEPLFDAGELLYGVFVAERYGALGPFISSHPDAVDPVVHEVIMGGAAVTGSDFAAALDKLLRLRSRVAQMFTRVDALLLPATPIHPLIEEVSRDPFAINDRLGIYSHFCNPLDLCAITLPTEHTPTGLPWGVTMYGPAFADSSLVDIGARYMHEEPAIRDLPSLPNGPLGRAGGRQLVVVAGAHLRGEPLNHELLSLGGRFVEQSATDAAYRFYALSTDPVKPALVRSSGAGVEVEVELWSLDADGFAGLIAATASPMAIGEVTLNDGRSLPGFLCQPYALEDARDITQYGGWRAFMASSTTPGR